MIPGPSVPFLTETTFWRRILGITKYVSCTEASAVTAANHADPLIPATSAEMIALYNTGEHTANGGRTQAQILTAIRLRYGHRPVAVSSFDAALTALMADYVLTVAGNYHNLPATLQRWDRSFAANPSAYHQVAVGPIAPGDTSDDPLVWWRDPLGYGTYRGEWVRWSVVKTFALQPLGVLAFPRLEWSMLPLTITGPGGGTATLNADSAIRLIDPAGVLVAPKVRTFALGWAVTLGGQWAGPGYLVIQDGKALVLLTRNATITPPAPPTLTYEIRGVVSSPGATVTWK